jgi:Fe-S cluster assembly protein SufD
VIALARPRNAVETALIDGFAPADSRDLREAAMTRFAARGLPTRRNEPWHYTDLRAALTQAAPLAGAPDALTATALRARLGPARGARVVLVDGHYVAELSQAGEGARIGSLAEALAEGAVDDIIGGFGLGGEDAALDLNTAFMQGGALIDVIAGADAVIEIVDAATGAEARASYVRSAVRVGKGARAQVVETRLALGGAAHQRNSTLIFDVGDFAGVEHVAETRGDGEGSVQVQSLLLRTGRSSRFESFALTLTGGLWRRQIFARLDGEGAHVALRGASLLKGREHGDTTLVVEHVARECESREFFRTIVDDEATGVFQGKIVVRSEAQKTDGSMKSNALLLKDGAGMFNKPELEIFADDVACGHGATVAQLDAAQVFYAQARGIPRRVAEAMLVEAFAGEAVDYVSDEALRERFRAEIHDWLATGEA